MEVKHIVREMISAGMPESDILANLRELGIENPEAVLSEAKSAVKPGLAPKPAQATPRVEIDNIPKKATPSLFDDDSSPKPSLFDERQQPMQSSVGELDGLSSGNPDQKLDELIALSKSLLELNKKILESNREILLRLEK
ncbi:MAG: hypothetical protein WC408_06805 [Candidatus Micrarchaeia archaeon]|jgi:hypothetical protein